MKIKIRAKKFGDLMTDLSREHFVAVRTGYALDATVFCFTKVDMTDVTAQVCLHQSWKQDFRDFHAFNCSIQNHHWRGSNYSFEFYCRYLVRR